MFVGIARLDLFIPSSASLKDKRHLLRAVTSVRPKFNVAIAEVDHQDLWQRASFGISCVAESAAHCRKVLQEVERAIARAVVGEAEIVGRSIEVVAMEDL